MAIFCKLFGEQALTNTFLPNTSLSPLLQSIFHPNYMSAVLCSDYSFLQQGLASQIPEVQGMMLGRSEEEVFLDFTSFK